MLTVGICDPHGSPLKGSVLRVPYYGRGGVLLGPNELGHGIRFEAYFGGEITTAGLSSTGRMRMRRPDSTNFRDMLAVEVNSRRRRGDVIGM